jgi:hypothetical protein
MLKENNTQRHFYIEEVILILLLTLSLVGVRITDYSPVDGYGYCFEVKSEYKPQVQYCTERMMGSRPILTHNNL